MDCVRVCLVWTWDFDIAKAVECSFTWFRERKQMHTNVIVLIFVLLWKRSCFKCAYVSVFIFLSLPVDIELNNDSQVLTGLREITFSHALSIMHQSISAVPIPPLHLPPPPPQPQSNCLVCQSLWCSICNFIVAWGLGWALLELTDT